MSTWWSSDQIEERIDIAPTPRAADAPDRTSGLGGSSKKAVIADIETPIARLNHSPGTMEADQQGKEPLRRKAWLFCGSDRGGERAATIYTLIVTAKLNGVDPRAWLVGVLRRIADHPASRLHELLPWNWNITVIQIRAAA